MTWHTPDGERVLEGAEAELLRESLAYLRDCVVSNLDSAARGAGWSTGVEAFDRRDSPARLVLLTAVGTALFRKTPTCPPLNILTEATVAALYETLKDLVDFELQGEDPEQTTIRALILNAVHQVNREMLESDDAEGDSPEDESTVEDDLFDLPPLHCEDPDVWHELIQILSNRILWDRDYLDSEKHIDAPPAEEGDYFQVQAATLTEDEIPVALEALDAVLKPGLAELRRHAAELQYVHVRLTTLLDAITSPNPPEDVAREIESILEVVQWPDEPTE